MENLGSSAPIPASLSFISSGVGIPGGSPSGCPGEGERRSGERLFSVSLLMVLGGVKVPMSVMVVMSCCLSKTDWTSDVKPCVVARTVCLIMNYARQCGGFDSAQERPGGAVDVCK